MHPLPAQRAPLVTIDEDLPSRGIINAPREIEHRRHIAPFPFAWTACTKVPTKAHVTDRACRGPGPFLNTGQNRAPVWRDPKAIRVAKTRCKNIDPVIINPAKALIA